MMVLPIVTGCGTLTKEQLKLQTEIVKSNKEIRLAIIDGYYYQKEVTDKKPPEGSGVIFPCGERCIADCSEECRMECRDMWIDSGCSEGAEEMEPDENFDWDDKNTGDYVIEPTDVEYTRKMDIQGDHVIEPTDVEQQPTDVEYTRKMDIQGDHNTQFMVDGNNHNITINNGVAAGTTPVVSPIDKAMAQLLLKDAPLLETSTEVIGREIRKGVTNLADNALKVAPAVLTGVAITKTADVIEKGFKEVGNKTQVGGNMSGVSSSENGGVATASPDQSTKTTTTTMHAAPTE